MRRLLLVLVTLLAIVAGVIAFAPASLVDGRLAAQTSGKLRLADASGTIWQGRGTVGDATGTWRVPVAWRIDPLDVLRGLHQVTLVPPAGATTPRGVVVVTDQGVVLRDLAVDLPAAALATAMPTRFVPTFGGTLAVTAPAFTADPGAPAGAATSTREGSRVQSAGTGSAADATAAAAGSRPARVRARRARMAGC